MSEQETVTTQPEPLADGVHPFTSDPEGEDRWTVILDGEQVAWAATEAEAHRSFAEMLHYESCNGYK